MKGPLTHPTEPAYPCFIPDLGELGEVSPREGSRTSLTAGEGPPVRRGVFVARDVSGTIATPGGFA